MNKSIESHHSDFIAVITGHGSYAPARILTNEDLAKMVETSDEWIKTRTGIERRHVCGKDESTAHLATEAAKKALTVAGLSPDKLELIIVATITPEMVFPSTACFVQQYLGAKNAWAFDLMAACSGFIYGNSIAQQFLESGRLKNALVIGAETLTKLTNYKDRTSCILFGDGAGAFVLEAKPRKKDEKQSKILYSTMYSDGSSWEALNCQAYGSRHPSTRPLENPNMIFMEIKGREVYQQAVRRIVETVTECLEKCKLKLDDVQMIISHQMNARIIESAAKRLELPPEKYFININEYGNTSSASVPLAFDQVVREGKIKRGDIVILVAFGAGLTWGANVIRF
ncbi:MAG: beta-ketoacyl-ACP synthase III [Sedimentisphaerales bacterium]|jgi:3-oxoacyl-[acyl-carrier-protein] synthase-3